MASIKEISQKTGFAIGTVSAVLNGKAKERRITEQTAVTIQNAAREMGYVPNIAARRLKSSSVMTHIALYVPADFEPTSLISFIHGFRDIIAAEENLEFSLKFYNSGQLSQALTQAKLNMLNAAIIFNPSATDFEFLDNTQFSIPIVLNSSNSKTHPAVSFNVTDTHSLVMDVFSSRNHKAVQLLTFENITFDWTDGEAKAHGIELLPTLESEDSFEGGYALGLEAVRSGTFADAYFSHSYRISIGFIRALRENGISIPESAELISMGHSESLDQYSTPVLSRISIPTETMAQMFYDKIMDMLAGKEVEHMTYYPVHYVAKDTCGPILP